MYKRVEVEAEETAMDQRMVSVEELQMSQEAPPLHSPPGGGQEGLGGISLTLTVVTGTSVRPLRELRMCPLQFGEHQGLVSTSCLRNQKGQSWQKWPEYRVETMVGK